MLMRFHEINQFEFAISSSVLLPYMHHDAFLEGAHSALQENPRVTAQVHCHKVASNTKIPLVRVTIVISIYSLHPLY